MAFTAAPVRTSNFLKWEADPNFSRESVTIGTGASLPAGQVLGKVTATSKYVAWAPAASDGSQTIAGILLTPANAASADVADVAIEARFALVDTSVLTYAGTLANLKTGLLALNIKAVDGVGYQPFAI